MGGTKDRPPSAASSGDSLPLEAVVPARAVLTELARGFLLVRGSDPEHAARFAQTFLREQAGPAPSPRAVSPAHLAWVRRGVASSLRDPGAP